MLYSRVILLEQNHRPTEQPLCYTCPPQIVKVISTQLKQEKMKDFFLGVEGCTYKEYKSYLVSSKQHGRGEGCKSGGGKLMAHGRDFKVNLPKFTKSMKNPIAR